MFVSMTRVRPVRLNMLFFTVLVLVNICRRNYSRVFVNMMNIIVIAQMRMSRLSMQVGA